MIKKTILSVYHTKNPFKPMLMYEEFQDFSIANIKKSKIALHKAKKKLRDREILIDKNSEKEKIFSGKVKRSYGFNYKRSLNIIEKICRQISDKYKFYLPLEEIYIMANPDVAGSIVPHLVNISKVFTIVSKAEPLINLYDEIYFRYGAIIRHINKLNLSVPGNSLIIKCTDGALLSGLKVPVINMCPESETTELILNLSDVFIYDEKIKSVKEAWNGTPGIELYELFDLIPSEKAIVDISKKADKIFLLDTEGN